MGSTGESIAIDLPPDRAFDLWTDVNRWPTFVDGFGGAERVDGEWPGLGSKVVLMRSSLLLSVVARETGRRWARREPALIGLPHLLDLRCAFCQPSTTPTSS